MYENMINTNMSEPSYYSGSISKKQALTYLMEYEFIWDLFKTNVKYLKLRDCDADLCAIFSLNHKKMQPYYIKKNTDKNVHFLPINLDTLRGIDDFEKKIKNICIDEINKSGDLGSLSGYWIYTHKELIKKVSKRLVYELWIPTVITRFQKCIREKQKYNKKNKDTAISLPIYNMNSVSLYVKDKIFCCIGKKDLDYDSDWSE